MATSIRAPRTASASATRSRKRPPLAPLALPTTDTTMPATDQASDMVPAELRFQWIAEAAYYIAERRGFRGGSPEDDWVQAEAQIDQLLVAPPA